ncbi:MAG: cytochrome b6-f complex subunit PetN [Acidobacteriota bacterium]
MPHSLGWAAVMGVFTQSLFHIPQLRLQEASSPSTQLTVLE